MADLPEFTWKPKITDGKLNVKFSNNRIEFANGNEQVQRTQVLPVYKIERTYSGLKEDMDAIREFFVARGGGAEEFWWYTDWNPVGRIKVRFASDECDIKETRGLRNDGTYGVIAHEVTLQFRGVN